MAFYLVTGGAGFIGSNLSEYLLKNGHKVRILDDFSSGKLENIADFKEDIEIIEGDIRVLDTVKKSAKGVDYVLHHAALASVPGSIKNPVDTNQINVEGTLNVLVASRDAGVKRVVFASSSSVYGDGEELPKNETIMPNPLSPYAVTKLVGELYAKEFYNSYRLETVSLRYFNVFGPRQNPKSQYSGVISIFADNLMRDRAPIIFGDGEQSRDFVHVDNVIAANIIAAQSDKLGRGEIINIGGGKGITLNGLMNLMNNILGKNIRPAYQDERMGDIKHSVADISLAEKLLDYKVRVDLSEGLNMLLTSD